MRLLQLTAGDFRFQKKYGIWLVYAVFTLFYVGVLWAVPEKAVNITGTILVYTDPAAMGLFFMGAMVLLEKSQRVNCSIAVAPVKTSEYILAKLISLMISGLVSGIIIFILGGIKVTLGSLLSIALSSMLFSLCGLFVAVNTDTLNQFTLATVPFEMFICLPAIIYIFGGMQSEWFIAHPGIAAIRLINGDGITLLCIMSLVIWILLVYFVTKRSVRKFFRKLGGGKV